MSPTDVRRVLVVDDSTAYCERWTRVLLDRYGPSRVAVEAYSDPIEALGRIDDGPVHFMLVDLEMPVLDGRKLVELAVARGVDRCRVIVSSSVDADQLHRLFPTGKCLAVINKADPAQQRALLMILDSLMRR